MNPGTVVWVRQEVTYGADGVWVEYGQTIPDSPLLRWLSGEDAEPDAGLVDRLSDVLVPEFYPDAARVIVRVVLDRLKGGNDGG